MGTFVVILQLLASLSILVVLHEFGHFIFARLFKIRVEKFRMFFDPWFTLFKFKPKNSDTEYGLGWLPLGGYVKIAGMIDESLDTDQMKKPAQPWEFRSHPAWQRFFVMLGGVLFNLLTAFAIYTGITYHYGDTYLPLEEVKTGMQFSPVAKKAGFQDGDMLLTADGQKVERFNEDNMLLVINAEKVVVLRDGKETTITMPCDFMQQMLREKKGFATYCFPFIIDSVIAGTPAAAANLKPNDRVIAVNGKQMSSSDITVTFRNNPGKELTLTVLREKGLEFPDAKENWKYLASVEDTTAVAGNERNIVYDTLQQNITLSKKGMIGVVLKGPAQLYNLKHVEYGLAESFVVGVGRAIKKLTSYTSDLKYVFTKEGFASVGGFGTVASLFPSTFDALTFWNMTAYLAVILAVMNLLPIPGLDGGHIVFVLYEMITRKKPSVKFMTVVQTIGMLFLVALMLYANLNDVFRFLK